METKPMDAIKSSAKPNDIAIFARLLENGSGKMPGSLARYVLKLGFDADDQARMNDLAERNQDGRITDDERTELNGYVHAGHMLALLQSKARQALRCKIRS